MVGFGLISARADCNGNITSMAASKRMGNHRVTDSLFIKIPPIKANRIQFNSNIIYLQIIVIFFPFDNEISCLALEILS